MTSESRSVQFYRGMLRDSKGRSLSEILGMSDSQLEYDHSYIQWLFPLRKPGANMHAPLADEETIRAFLESSALRETLCASCGRLLELYGMACQSGVPPSTGVSPTDDFKERSKLWLRGFSHDHLRLSRIIGSLATLGLGKCSKEIYWYLESVVRSHPGIIQQSTLRYWMEAAGFTWV